VSFFVVVVEREYIFMELIGACIQGDTEKILSLIKKNEIDVNKKEDGGVQVPTAIWCTANYGHLHAMEILMCSDQIIDTKIRAVPSALDPDMEPWEVAEGRDQKHMVALLRFYEVNPAEVRKLMRLKHQYVESQEKKKK